MNFNEKINPQYEKIHPWELYSADLDTEFRQCMDEGKDIAKYESLFRDIAALPADEAREKLADVLYQIVLNAPIREDYKFVEPSDLDGIRALRQDHRPGSSKPDRGALYKKLLGAWTGRICGCLLGKPVEGRRTDRLVPFLKATGNYPMHRYIRESDIVGDVERDFGDFHGACYADRVDGMPIDDDTNYTVLYYTLVSWTGRDFTPYDAARHWIANQPMNAYCTAERAAFRNFCAGYYPPQSAIYKNPYREWIGAQIRGDLFGYVNPGSPEAAAEMAWRDASISHVKNGIYGEMFASAMIAAAAVLDDMREIIEAGLAQIPKTSRLYADIHKVIDCFESGKSEEDCFAMIHASYDEYTAYGWCHTNPNAMIVVASLLYGGDDYGTCICKAVQTGFDTDCNGATVGSVFGMRYGIDAISEEWKAPVHDLLHTSIFGMENISISDMAARTFDMIPG